MSAAKHKRLAKPLRDLNDIRVTFECWSPEWWRDMSANDREAAVISLAFTLKELNGHLHAILKIINEEDLH